MWLNVRGRWWDNTTRGACHARHRDTPHRWWWAVFGRYASYSPACRCCAWRVRRELRRGDTTLAGKLCMIVVGPSEVAIGRGLLVHTAEIGMGGRCARLRMAEGPTEGGEAGAETRWGATECIHTASGAVCIPCPRTRRILLESMQVVWRANHSTIISRMELHRGR